MFFSMTSRTTVKKKTKSKIKSILNCQAVSAGGCSDEWGLTESAAWMGCLPNHAQGGKNLWDLSGSVHEFCGIYRLLPFHL